LNVVATAKSVCPNQNTLWYAHLCNSAGLVYNERVNSKEALQQYTICKDIREALLPPDHQELANIYGNLATVMPMYPGTEQALEECKELLLKALKIELGKPTEESVKNIFIRYQNLGLVLALLKQYEDGTRYILLGRETARKAFGMDVHWEAKYVRRITQRDRVNVELTVFIYRASYKLGYIEFEQQHYDKAKEHFDAAFTGFNSLNPTLPATTAAQYKSACCDIEAGLLPSAM
jgi:tetratricopeptide (TPR) repeat protein